MITSDEDGTPTYRCGAPLITEPLCVMKIRKMGYSAKEIFDSSISRAEHFISLYQILHDSRSRRGRRDWKAKFKALMHWPQNVDFYRIDGENTDSILLIKTHLGITPEKFRHDYVSELLRSVIISSVAAMDRYFHDLIINHTVKFLGKPESSMPKEFKKLKLDIVVTKKALEKIRSNPKARPNTIIKSELQKMLHKEYKFQTPNDLLKGSKILGIKDFWRTAGLNMNPVRSGEDLKSELTKITRRRNQIVHESDIVLKTSAKEISLREIDIEEARNACSLIRDLVDAIDLIPIN